MRWTPYLDECLRLLEEKREYPTDLLLVYLVRVQLISNKLACAPWNDTFGDAMTKFPPEFYLKALQSQLDDLKRNIPPELQTNSKSYFLSQLLKQHVLTHFAEILQLHVLNTVLSMHEHSLSMHEHSLSISPSKNISSDSSTQLQRIENLWTCLTTTKSWFATFLSLDSFPLSCYPQMSMAILAQMAHCLVALFRLSTFESPNVLWDRQRVRQELDLGEVVKLMSDRWGGVSAAAGLDTSGMGENGEDLWILTKRFMGIGNWWEMKVAAAAAAATEAEREGGRGVAVGHGNGNGNEVVDGLGVPGPQQMEAMDFAAMNVDFLEDVWIKDLLAGGCEFTFEAFL